MSGRRFELLLRFLHLNDSRKQHPRGDPNYDKLYKIRPFLDTIVSNFKIVYLPRQNVSIDESIVGFKGRLSFVQYMPKKPTKWGIKAWVLAEFDTGYVWNLKVYTGPCIVHCLWYLPIFWLPQEKTEMQILKEICLTMLSHHCHLTFPATLPYLLWQLLQLPNTICWPKEERVWGLWNCKNKQARFTRNLQKNEMC